MLRTIISVLCVILSAALAQAQTNTVRQSGNVTPRHGTMWTTTGVIQDAGTAANGGYSSLGVTNNGGQGICVNSAAITGPYNQICLGTFTNGNGVLSVQNYGGAASGGIEFNVNGIPANLVTALAPISPGTVACFADSIGTITSAGCTSVNPISSGMVCDGDVAKAVANRTAFAAAIVTANGKSPVYVSAGTGVCWMASGLLVNIDRTRIIIENGATIKWAVDQAVLPAIGATTTAGSTSVTGISSTAGFVAGMRIRGDGFSTALFAPASIGSKITGNALITGLPTTAGMAPGMGVRGPGIPASTTIVSVDSLTQITMSAVATRTETSTVNIFSFGTKAIGSDTITGVPAAAVALYAKGMTVTGTGLPVHTVICTATGTTITIGQNDVGCTPVNATVNGTSEINVFQRWAIVSSVDDTTPGAGKITTNVPSTTTGTSTRSILPFTPEWITVNANYVSIENHGILDGNREAWAAVASNNFLDTAIRADGSFFSYDGNNVGVMQNFWPAAITSGDEIIPGVLDANTYGNVVQNGIFRRVGDDFLSPVLTSAYSSHSRFINNVIDTAFGSAINSYGVWSGTAGDPNQSVGTILHGNTVDLTYLLLGDPRNGGVTMYTIEGRGPGGTGTGNNGATISSNTIVGSTQPGSVTIIGFSLVGIVTTANGNTCTGVGIGLCMELKGSGVFDGNSAYDVGAFFLATEETAGVISNSFASNVQGYFYHAGPGSYGTLNVIGNQCVDCGFTTGKAILHQGSGYVGDFSNNEFYFNVGAPGRADVNLDFTGVDSVTLNGMKIYSFMTDFDVTIGITGRFVMSGAELINSKIGSVATGISYGASVKAVNAIITGSIIVGYGSPWNTATALRTTITNNQVTGTQTTVNASDFLALNRDATTGVVTGVNRTLAVTTATGTCTLTFVGGLVTGVAGGAACP